VALQNFPSRALHDVGLAAWFGGTLANAVSLNRAAGETNRYSTAGRVTNAGWDAWTPVNATAIGAHVVGAVGQLLGNRDRVAAQKSVAAMAVTKTVLTAAALGVTAYSRVLGRKVSQQPDVPVESGTQPAETTPPDVAKAQQQLKVLQWAVPAITGAIIVVSAYAGEQQRPAAVQGGSAAAAEPPVVKEGLLQRLIPVALQGGSAAAAEPPVVKEGLLQRLIPVAVKEGLLQR
jgi:hypothetical protein